MEIKVNSQKKIVNDNCLLSLVKDLLGEKTGGIAIAVNETIIPKTLWHTTSLKENDAVLIIKATQGG
jgi:sulfur carrier protein